MEIRFLKVIQSNIFDEKKNKNWKKRLRITDKKGKAEFFFSFSSDSGNHGNLDSTAPCKLITAY